VPPAPAAVAENAPATRGPRPGQEAVDAPAISLLGLVRALDLGYLCKKTRATVALKAEV
jgi:hypothetical protein